MTKKNQEDELCTCEELPKIFLDSAPQRCGDCKKPFHLAPHLDGGVSLEKYKARLKAAGLEHMS